MPSDSDDDDDDARADALEDDASLSPLARGGDGARAGVFERDDDDDDDDGWCAREATDGARARENFGRRSR